MTETTPPWPTSGDDDGPIVSYASEGRRRAYITAMRALAADREPGKPARVYISVNPTRPRPATRAWLARTLPGVELLTFTDVFEDGTHYHQHWPQFAESLDGLILIADKKGPHRGYVHRPGVVARNELKLLVGMGKPVLLVSGKHGLVPLVDCAARKYGEGSRERLVLRVPPAWNRKAETLRAAFEALNVGQRTDPVPS